jgi:hypothetical protein
MRFPRLRFTLKRMMVVVVFLGLVMGPGAEVARLIQLAYRFRQCAIGCRDMAEASRRTAASLATSWRTMSPAHAKARRGLQAAEERWIKYGDYHSRFALKYDRYAMRPWLPIEDYSPPDYPFPNDWYLGPR